MSATPGRPSSSTSLHLGEIFAAFLTDDPFCMLSGGPYPRLDSADRLPTPSGVLFIEFHTVDLWAEAEHVHVLEELMVLLAHPDILAVEALGLHSFELGCDLLGIRRLRLGNRLSQHHELVDHPRIPKADSEFVTEFGFHLLRFSGFIVGVPLQNGENSV